MKDYEKFDNNILTKIDNNEELTAEEVEYLILEHTCDTIKGEERRWSRFDTCIVKFKGRYFSLEYEYGLTELQESEYYPQKATEVVQVEKTIVIKEWVEKGD